MNVILFAAAVILSVASSEITRDRQIEDVKNISIDDLNDRNNSFQSSLENEPEDYDQSNESNSLDAVPGVPGKDYPNFVTIPKTSFSCADKIPGGYYADIETRCQVFHVCNVGNVKSSFLCPPGSIFNQKYLVCDWWYDFECENAGDLYSLNDSINRGEIGSNPSGTGENYTPDKNSQLSLKKDSSFADQESNWVNDGVDLSLAGTGEGGLGYSGNKSNRPFGDYQTNIKQNTQFASRSDGNSNSAKQLEIPSTSNDYARNEFSHRKPSRNNKIADQNSNEKDRFGDYSFVRENSSPNYNTQHQSADFPFHENSQQFSDSIPRGFATNYGKTNEVQNQNFNNQENQRSYNFNQRTEFTSSSESHSKQENQNVPSDRKHVKNTNKRRDFEEKENNGDILNSNLDEDEFYRQRQKEVDNTILNKKIVNYGNGGEGFNFEYDSEARKLSSENPPSLESGSYYNSDVNPRNKEDSNERNRYFNANIDQTRNGPNTGERSASGGFGIGFGNARSNSISGITENNSRPQKQESYLNSKDTVNSNSRALTGKETAGDSVLMQNSKNNESSTFQGKTPGTRSFGQFSEISSGRDLSRPTEEEFTFRQNHNVAKESFETGFNGNENSRKEARRFLSSDQIQSANKKEQNSNYQSVGIGYVPLLNYEESNEQKTKGLQYSDA